MKDPEPITITLAYRTPRLSAAIMLPKSTSSQTMMSGFQVVDNSMMSLARARAVLFANPFRRSRSSRRWLSSSNGVRLPVSPRFGPTGNASKPAAPMVGSMLG